MRVIGLTHTVVDHHLALVAADDETLGEGHDLLDAEALAWVVIQRPLHFASLVAENYLTLICAHQDFAFGKPAMSCVILRNMTVFFFSDHTGLWLKDFFFFDEVLVGLIAGDKYNIGVQVAEADLGTDRVTRVMTHGLAGDATTLVHLPNVDHLVRLRAQSDEKFLVLGAESHRNEALVLLDLC